MVLNLKNDKKYKIMPKINVLCMQVNIFLYKHLLFIIKKAYFIILIVRIFDILSVGDLVSYNMDNENNMAPPLRPRPQHTWYFSKDIHKMSKLDNHAVTDIMFSLNRNGQEVSESNISLHLAEKVNIHSGSETPLGHKALAELQTFLNTLNKLTIEER